jgi:hypothetical protein
MCHRSCSAQIRRNFDIWQRRELSQQHRRLQFHRCVTCQRSQLSKLVCCPKVKQKMATLDDKLLGEKLQYYCSSSSESEGEDEDDAVESDEGKIQSHRAASSSTSSYEMQEWQGTSTNVNRSSYTHTFSKESSR